MRAGHARGRTIAKNRNQSQKCGRMTCLRRRPPGGPGAPSRCHTGPMAGHDHGHDHSPGGHSHAIADDAVPRWLAWALVVNLAFMLVEVTTGILADSLALLSDAAHMLTDAAAIGLALVPPMARRHPGGSMTFGYRRADPLGARQQVRAARARGVHRLRGHPAPGRPAQRRRPHVRGRHRGLFVNLLAAWFLAKANRESLSVEGAFQRNLIDAYCRGTAVAAVLIWVWGFDRADAIASLLIAIPMVFSGVGLVRASGRILLEAAPAASDPDTIGPAMVRTPGVVEVHDLHVWEVSNGFTALSAHVVVGADEDCHAVRRAVEHRLHEDFGLEHTTLQVDHQTSDLLEIQSSPTSAPQRRC